MKALWYRLLGCAGIALALAALAGCHALPRTYNDPNLNEPATIERLFASDYWSRLEAPPLTEKGYRKIALTEFSVEFATHKVLLAGAAPASRVDWTLYTPIGLIRAMFGIGRRLTEFDNELVETLPAQMYEDFVAQLEDSSYTVLPKTYVGGAPAVREYRTENSHDSSWLRYFNPVGTDTGRVAVTKTHPIEGLKVVIGAMDGLAEDVDLKVKRQVRADVVVRARFRVGVHKGVAAVESGSIVFVTADEVHGYLQSHRSLVSATPVVNEDAGGFMPFVGTTYVVDTKKFKAAMKQLFPTYLTLARRPESEGKSEADSE